MSESLYSGSIPEDGEYSPLLTSNKVIRNNSNLVEDTRDVF